MKIIRVAKECERAGAYYVRMAAMMHKYQIPLDAEIDSHDGENCHYILALDGIYPVATCRWLAGFYEKMGYRFNESGKAHHDTFECVYMEKEL